MATCPSGHESASDDFCDVCGILIGAPAAFAAAPDAPAAFAAAPDAPAPDAPAPGTAAPGTAAQPTVPAASAETCPHCTTPRTGQFCESCGYAYPYPTPTTAPLTTAPPTTTTAPAATAPPTTAPPTTAPTTTAAPPTPPAPAASPPPPTFLATSAAPPSTVWTAVVTADRDYFEVVQAAGGPDAAAITFPAYCPERRFRLSGAEVRVGRRSASRGIDPEIDLTGPPTDPGVSRLHAVFVAAADGTWSLVDPGSENGTLLNGAEIPQGTSIPLHDGDRIHLGAWTALTITTRQP
jgi:hypothetical protein